MNILVAVDLSEASRKILEEAKKWANVSSSKVWVLHVVEAKPDFIDYVDYEPVSWGGLEPCYVGYGPNPKPTQNDILYPFKKERKALQEEVGNLKRSGIDAVPLLIQGSVIEVILRESKKLGVDMIVVGSHRHSAVYHWVIPSISDGLLKKSTCPVLVIPTDDQT